MKLLLVLGLFASSVALADETHHVYRLEFTISENDPGKPPTSTTYTLNVEERRSGEIKMGSNVPLPSGATTTRADIGLSLRANVVAIGDDLLLDSEVEITTAKDAQTFRKLVARGNALISQNKPALVASIEDPLSHQRHQVTVTATKLR